MAKKYIKPFIDFDLFYFDTVLASVQDSEFDFNEGWFGVSEGGIGDDEVI